MRPGRDRHPERGGLGVGGRVPDDDRDVASLAESGLEPSEKPLKNIEK